MRGRLLLPIVALLPTLGPIASTPASADQFGCTVLLCMSNPQGWASVPVCVQPVQLAFSLAARGRGWPQCPEANMSAQQSQTPNSVDVTTKDGTRTVPVEPTAPK